VSCILAAVTNCFCFRGGKKFSRLQPSLVTKISSKQNLCRQKKRKFISFPAFFVWPNKHGWPAAQDQIQEMLLVAGALTHWIRPWHSWYILLLLLPLLLSMFPILLSNCTHPPIFLPGYVYVIVMLEAVIPFLWSSPLLGVCQLLIAHATAGLLLVSYLRAIFSDPGYPPLSSDAFEGYVLLPLLLLLLLLLLLPLCAMFLCLAMTYPHCCPRTIRLVSRCAVRTSLCLGTPFPATSCFALAFVPPSAPNASFC